MDPNQNKRMPPDLPKRPNSGKVFTIFAIDLLSLRQGSSKANKLGGLATIRLMLTLVGQQVSRWIRFEQMDHGGVCGEISLQK